MAEPPPWDDPLERFVARGEVPWEERDGVVVVAIPKDEGRFQRLVSRLLRAPESVSVRLDEAGSATWLLADGSRTGEDVARDLAARFGGDGWAARVKTFLGALALRGLVRLSFEPTKVADPFRGFPAHLGYREAPCRRCGTIVRLKGPAGAFYQCPGCRRMTRAR